MPWTFYNSSGEALTSFGPVALTDLDIDGGTDVGEAIVDADLFIIDNGAGGTNVKTAASRIVTYVGANTDTRSGSAKCWAINAADGASVLASYNLASLTDSGTGDRTFVFDTDFSSVNYAAVGSAGNPAGTDLQAPIFGQNTRLVGSMDCLMRSSGGGNVDVINFAAFFGDQ